MILQKEELTGRKILWQTLPMKANRRRAYSLNLLHNSGNVFVVTASAVCFAAKAGKSDWPAGQVSRNYRITYARSLLKHAEWLKLATHVSIGPFVKFFSILIRQIGIYIILIEYVKYQPIKLLILRRKLKPPRAKSIQHTSIIVRPAAYTVESKKTLQPVQGSKYG